LLSEIDQLLSLMNLFGIGFGSPFFDASFSRFVNISR